jgi:glycogen debranching enzyme
MSKEEKYQIFEDKLLHFQMKYNLLGIVDIVLNHTSHHSQWLHDNPDAGYNLVNSPHLNSAYLLDEVLYILIISAS